MITSILLSFPNLVRAAFCIALSIEPITSSLSIDFSLATASTILNSSSLSNPLFNIYIVPKKKWASAHFENSIVYLIFRRKLRFFQDYNLNKSVLSVFSHENSPLLVAFLPKWP